MTAAPVGVVHRGKRGAGRAERGRPAGLVEDGIEEQRAATARAQRLDRLEVAVAMHGHELGPTGRCRVVHHDTGLASQPLEQNAKPGRSLGVVRSRIVTQAIGVGEDRDRHEIQPRGSSSRMALASSRTARRASAISSSWRSYHRQ